MAGLIRRVKSNSTFGTLMIVLMSVVCTAYPQQRHPRQNKPRSKESTVKTTDSQWYTFTGPDKDFSVEFPNEPKRAEDVQGTITVLRRYVSTIDNTYFEISIQDFGGPPGSTEANSYDSGFEQDLSRLLNNDGFKIVQLRRTAKNIYEMEAWAPSQTPGKYQHNLARGILHNGRQYRMGCNSLLIGQEADRNLCRRFFNSFKIIGAPR